MTNEEAIERIEFRIKRHCIEACEDSGGKCGECWRYPCNDMKAVELLAQERPRGEWQQVGEMTYRCTNCGWLKNIGLMPYCENCGADMRKESKEE